MLPAGTAALPSSELVLLRPAERWLWHGWRRGGLVGWRGVLDATTAAAHHLIERLTAILVGWAAGEVPHLRAFSDGLPPNRAGLFPGTRLSRASVRDARPRGTPRVDGDVAVVAGDQGLPLARGHLLDPGRDRPTAMALEILQVAHVVDLHAVV